MAPHPTSLPADAGALVASDTAWRQFVERLPAVTYVADFDEQATLRYLSPHIETLLGYPRDAFLEDQDLWYRCVHPDDLERVRSEEVRTWAMGEDFYATYRMVAADGHIVYVLEHDAIVRDDLGRPLYTQGVLLDVTTLHETQAELDVERDRIAHLAYHDPLTGLSNRAQLHEHLDLALARAERSSQAVAVLYLDLDDFKLVNDSLGHAAGDQLLRKVAARLKTRTRATDLLARQGGDEFLLLIADLDPSTAAETATKVGEAMLEALGTPFVVSGAEFHIGASAGVSLYPRDARDAETLLRHADAAMYQAKASGRGGVQAYSSDRGEPLRRLAMTSRLRHAIAEEELLLHWQPVVDPTAGRLHSLEALVRWADPLRGQLLPAEFVPFAESSGLIDRLGAHVLDLALRQSVIWRAEGFNPRVAVNLSARQLRRRDLAGEIAEALVRHGVEPACLTLEITETAAMQDTGSMGGILTELADTGVHLAIDDFGAGFSSLARIRELPVHVLKIDRLFLAEAPQDPSAKAIVTAIVEMAGALGMTAVAEGVETDAQRRLLVELGCPLAQGYLLGRPAPADRITPILAAAGLAA